jgi:hypothetical protein
LAVTSLVNSSDPALFIFTKIMCHVHALVEALQFRMLKLSKNQAGISAGDHAIGELSSWHGYK